MTEQELRERLAAYDAILAVRNTPGPCACMGAQGDDPLCPCAMSAATDKTLRRERDMTVWALARATGQQSK